MVLTKREQHMRFILAIHEERVDSVSPLRIFRDVFDSKHFPWAPPVKNDE